jgi:RsmE family RNA methyltransferase
MPKEVEGGRPLAIAVGPEGGWTDFEIERFDALGFLPVSLGRRILKVETAVPYLFGALGLCTEVDADEPHGKVSQASDSM